MKRSSVLTSSDISMINASKPFTKSAWDDTTDALLVNVTGHMI